MASNEKRRGREATGPYCSIGGSPTRTGFAFSEAAVACYALKVDNV